MTDETTIINKEDARIVRTKRDLANALEDLLKERSMSEISIKDITDRALISKNTFYKYGFCFRNHKKSTTSTGN